MKSNHNKISRIAIKLLYFFYFTIGTVFCCLFYTPHIHIWTCVERIPERSFFHFWRLCLLSSLTRWNEANFAFRSPTCAPKYFMKMRACYQPIWMCFLFAKCSPSFWELIGVRFFSLFLLFFLSEKIGHAFHWKVVGILYSTLLIWNVTEAYMHERGCHDVCDAYTVWVSKAIVYTNTTTASCIWVPLRVI